MASRIMKITAIETIQFDEDSELTDTERDINLSILRLHTTDVTGHGETFPLAEAESDILHGPIADQVLGRDAHALSAIRDDLANYFNYYGHAGAEWRALSALDLACWDAKARAAGLPLYELLGGAAREEIPVYNTCYETDFGFRTEPVALANSLLEEGITSMKIWPFDEFATDTRGQRITNAQLQAGLEPFERIANEVPEMDVALEGHGQWALTPATKIARAVEAFDPVWIEDLIRKGTPDTYAELADMTDAPLCVSERLIGRYEFEAVIETGAIDIVMPDICWTGGLSEAMTIANVAETHQLPVAPHNSGGPFLHAANAHFAATIPNLYVMESIRDRYDGWHRNLITDPLPARESTINLPEGPGLGTKLDPDILDHPDTTVERTER